MNGLVLLFAVIGFLLCAFGLFIAGFSWWVKNTWGAGSADNGSPIGFGLFLLLSGAVVLWACYYSVPHARAAELTVTPLPHAITHGHRWGEIGRFGTYSDAYLARRWTAMCATAARYQAMSEAYEHGKAQPCK